MKDQVRRFFIICFGLLQNATTIDQFESYLNSIIIVFQSDYADENYLKSFENLTKEIKNRDINVMIGKENYYDFENNYQTKQKYVFPVGEKVYKVLKNESPFKIHFIEKIDKLKQKIKLENISNSTRKNIYHAPGFLEVIYDLIHILPLWTGVMLNEWNKKFPKYKFPCRLSNNPVENHFKIIKHSILNKQTKVTPSVMASLFYVRIQSKYLQHYEKKESICFEKERPIMFYEKWLDKKVKPKYSKTKKTSYYSNFHDIIMKSEIDFEKDENDPQLFGNNFNFPLFNFLLSNFLLYTNFLLDTEMASDDTGKIISDFEMIVSSDEADLNCEIQNSNETNAHQVIHEDQIKFGNNIEDDLIYISDEELMSFSESLFFMEALSRKSNILNLEKGFTNLSSHQEDTAYMSESKSIKIL